MSKLVCISGCSRGLGRAMAKEFANRCLKVAGGARNKEALLKLKDELGDRHFLDTFDVTFPTQVDDFAKKVVNNVGIPDLLINNAGLINQNAPSLKSLQKNLLRFWLLTWEVYITWCDLLFH